MPKAIHDTLCQFMQLCCDSFIIDSFRQGLHLATSLKDGGIKGQNKLHKRAPSERGLDAIDCVSIRYSVTSFLTQSDWGRARTNQFTMCRRHNSCRRQFMKACLQFMQLCCNSLKKACFSCKNSLFLFLSLLTTAYPYIIIYMSNYIIIGQLCAPSGQ